MRTDRITFAANAEQFRLNRIQMPVRVNLFSKYFIQRIGQDAHAGKAGPLGVSLYESGIQKFVTVGVAELSAYFSVPILRQAIPCSIQKSRMALVGVAQRETVGGLWVGKIGWVKIHPMQFFLGPIDPALKVFGFNCVTVNISAAVVEIAGVQVQAMICRGSETVPFRCRREVLQWFAPCRGNCRWPESRRITPSHRCVQNRRRHHPASSA